MWRVLEAASLTPQQWADVERLYQAARDLDDERRRALLNEACGGDAAVRAEVESLLAYESAADRFLEFPSPAHPVAPPDAGIAPHPFRWIVRTAAAATAALFLYAAWILPSPLTAFGWNARAQRGELYITAVDPGGPAAGLLQRGDRLVSVNGDVNVSRVGAVAHRNAMAVGEIYQVVIERGGERQAHTLQAGARPRDLRSELAWYLMSLVWCGVGLFIGFVRPGHAAARLACASSLAVGLVFLQGAIIRTGPALAPLHVVLGYHFFLLFPAGRPPRGLWVPALWSLYVSAAVPVLIRSVRWATAEWAGPGAATELMAAHPGLFRLSEALSLFAYSSALVLMVAAIVWNYRVLVDEDQRRRIRWVALGSSVAVAGQLWWAAGLVLDFVGNPIDIAPIDLSAAAVTVPVAVAYAVLRHHVFDVRVVVRRGLQHLLARRALQTLTAVPAIVLAAIVIVNRDQTIAELIRGGAAYFAWMGAAGLGLVFRRPATLWLDRRFFREEYDREQILFGALEHLQRASSEPDLWSLVAERIEVALHPKALHFWYREPGGLTLHFASGALARHVEPPAAVPLLARLEEAPAILDVSAASGTALTADEAAWLAAQSTALVISVTDSSGQLEGIWLLGERRSETPYTPGDHRLLQAIARQTAVVRENLRLRAQVTEGDRVRRDVLARLVHEAFNLLKECPACGACFDNVATSCDRDGHALTTTLPVDRTIGGRYRLDRAIGRGGMGAVYEAADLDLRRTVAVKIILARAFGQQTALRRFAREARAAASLAHPNIVRIFDFGRLEGEGAYLVMERLSGLTLREAIDRNGPLPPRDAADWFAPLLDGLAAAHAAGIVHRDLKPENLMRDGRTPPSTVKILDFGLAKVRFTGAVSTASLTAGGLVAGTLGYMSPEQRQGGAVDHRSDLFAVGVMLAEALTGRRPVTADGYGGVPATALHLDERSAAEHRVLDDLVRRCLAQAPPDRPASAAALREALVPALGACPPLRP
jgi:eukaryotic-like serine/threonine-protein kinase